MVKISENDSQMTKKIIHTFTYACRFYAALCSDAIKHLPEWIYDINDEIAQIEQNWIVFVFCLHILTLYFNWESETKQILDDET